MCHQSPSAVLDPIRQDHSKISNKAMSDMQTLQCQAVFYTSHGSIAIVKSHTSTNVCAHRVDFFGPVYIRNIPEATTVWVSLFTCMVTRAIHLEVVNDMTTIEFLLAFHQFVAHRGMPELVVTDNAPQVKVTDTAIQRAFTSVINHSDVFTFLSRNCINWQFIVESAPWMSGFYERLVGTVKSALRKVVGKSLLDSTQLYTTLTEVEATVNTRPLVYISDESEPLTLMPSQFLSLSNSHGGILLGLDDDSDFQPASLSTSDHLLEFWKKGQRRLDQAWKSWRDDYLQSL